MYTNTQLNDIYDRTDGQCYICRKKLIWSNYGDPGNRGAWEVDHSNPRVKGGTDRILNLYAACIPCNRSEGSKSTRSQRTQFGYIKAPESRRKKAERTQLYFIWVAIIFIIGLLLNKQDPEIKDAQLNI